jgi:hypothetical protein
MVAKVASPFASVRWIPRRNVPLSPWTPEYRPRASQCQTSTAAPLIGLHEDTSTTVVFRVSGRPGRPSVMSRRTFSPAM